MPPRHSCNGKTLRAEKCDDAGECDGRDEVVAEHSQQVDVVHVSFAGEAVCQVCSWVDVRQHLAALRAQEAKPAIAQFRGWPVAAECGIASRADHFGNAASISCTVVR